MGLDLVEFIMEVEPVFGIAIPDEDASRLDSVGQLYDYILAHLPHRETQACLSAATFYRFRRALIAEFGVDRRDVRLAVAVDDLIPKSRRRSEWLRLGQCLDRRLPPLVRPAWMSSALWVLLFFVSIASMLIAWEFLGFSANGLLFVVLALLFGNALIFGVAYWLTTPFATKFPWNVREAIAAVLALNYGKISDERAGWNRREVWEILRAIIVEQFGVAPEEVRESAEFVRDFGA